MPTANSSDRGDRLKREQAGSDGAFHVVLVCPRKAEEDQCAVAHRWGIEAAVVLHCIGYAAVKLADQFREIFGIDPRREFARPDQVTEDDAQLTPFGTSLNRHRDVCRLGRRERATT
jgi:hypothetical protein